VTEPKSQLFENKVVTPRQVKRGVGLQKDVKNEG